MALTTTGPNSNRTLPSTSTSEFRDNLSNCIPTESLIDNPDKWLIGGPGSLPGWLLTEEPVFNEEIPNTIMQEAAHITIRFLDTLLLDYTSVL